VRGHRLLCWPCLGRRVRWCRAGWKRQLQRSVALRLSLGRLQEWRGGCCDVLPLGSGVEGVTAAVAGAKHTPPTGRLLLGEAGDLVAAVVVDTGRSVDLHPPAGRRPGNRAVVHCRSAEPLELGAAETLLATHAVLGVRRLLNSALGAKAHRLPCPVGHLHATRPPAFCWLPPAALALPDMEAPLKRSGWLATAAGQ